jgi:two-component system, OmpR family, sensor kinase
MAPTVVSRLGTMSLRARLLAGLLALAAAGLTVSAGAVYAATGTFLRQRIDQQLLDSRRPVLNELAQGERFLRRLPSGRSVIPTGTYGELRRSDGPVFRYRDPDGPNPKLPQQSPAGERFLTVGSDEPGLSYRVQSTPLEGDSGTLLVAFPLNEVNQTLHRLLLTEGVVAAAVLGLLAGLALWVVRLGLRPLDHIAEVAGAIAAGDLSQRVAPAESRTEIGRLGLALNAMLAQIEDAFGQRRASEERLRRFVADASHELRTPLTAIRGYSELFRRGAAERPEDLARAMRRIEDEATRMGVLVDDLLLLARLDQGRPLELRPVDLVPLAADAIGDLQAVDATRPVRFDHPTTLIVAGDEARLRQVVGNLVGNATQHTPVGTPVHVSLLQHEDRAILQVADEGPGIPPEAREQIFERFYRADPARARTTGGSGLGLSIVAAIAAAHGGSARAGDRAGGPGACFTVELPIPSSLPGELQAPPSPVEWDAGIDDAGGHPRTPGPTEGATR